MFHLLLLFELLSLSDPGHKSFGKHETGSMFWSLKTLNRCVQHMSAWSLRNTVAFRSDYDFQTVFKVLDYSSINLNCCINTYEYLILTIKENCETVVTWGGGGWAGRIVTKVMPALASLIPHADVTVISNYSYDLCVDSYNDMSSCNCLQGFSGFWRPHQFKPLPLQTIAISGLSFIPFNSW